MSLWRAADGALSSQESGRFPVTRRPDANGAAGANLLPLRGGGAAGWGGARAHGGRGGTGGGPAWFKLCRAAAAAFRAPVGSSYQEY